MAFCYMLGDLTTNRRRAFADDTIVSSGFDLSLAYSDSDDSEDGVNVAEGVTTMSHDLTAAGDVSTTMSGDAADTNPPSADGVTTMSDAGALPARQHGLSPRQRLRLKQERARIRRTLYNIQSRRDKRSLKALHHPSLGELPVVSETREVIADTGASEDLIARWIAARYTQYITKTDNPIALDTASGTATCDEQLQFVWKQLGELGSALILPDTPSVLSVGRRCIDQGWHFEWPAYSHSPFMIKPDGDIV